MATAGNTLGLSSLVLLLGVPACFGVLLPNCSAQLGMVSYSHWNGGQAGDHASAQTLVEQLLAFEAKAQTLPNMGVVFQAQLTETPGDIEQCLLGTLPGCPKLTSCALHASRLSRHGYGPALEYWQFGCQRTHEAVVSWYLNRTANATVPNRAINVILLDMLAEYFALPPAHAAATPGLLELTLRTNALLGAGNCSGGATALAARPGKWMGALVNCSSAPLSLSELTLLGAHDAGTYVVYNDSDAVEQVFVQSVCAGRPELCKLFTGLSAGVIGSFAATQGASLRQTLDAGARYLDLRIMPVSSATGKTFDGNASAIAALNGSNAVGVQITHNFVLLKLSLAAALSEVATFLDANPSEVVLVYLSHFQGDGVYAADVFAALLPLFNEQLVQVVSSALGDRIVRNCDPAAARLPTLQEVLARPGANGRGGAVLLYDPKTNAELDLPCPAKEAPCPRELFFNAGGSS